MRIRPITFRPQAFLSASAYWRGHIALASSIAAGAWAVIFIRLAQQHEIPSLLIGAIRLTLAALILTPIVLPRYGARILRIRRRDLLLIGAGGFWLALLFATAAFALEHTTVLITSVLFGTSPLWIALLEMFFLKMRLRQIARLGLAITLVGSTIIALSGSVDFSNLGRSPLLGSLFAIMGAAAFSCYAVVGRKLRQQVPFLLYMWLVFVCAAVISLFVVAFTHTPVLGHSAGGYFWVLMITLVPHLIGQLTFNYAIRHLPATYCSVVGQLEIVFSATIAFLLFQEVPGALQLPGSLAIIIGVTLVNLGQPPSDAESLSA